MSFPRKVEKLIQELEKLPGIGRRSAERIAFHILRAPGSEAGSLAAAIHDAHADTRFCSVCSNVTESDPCPLCGDSGRSDDTVLVVEDPRDVEAFERAGVYKGRYHVLLGSLNPAEGVEPRHLSVERLVERVRTGGVSEVILATDPDLEGEGTAMLLSEILQGLDTKVTRLARGLPAGSSIEYLHRAVLQDALDGRRDAGSR